MSASEWTFAPGPVIDVVREQLPRQLREKLTIYITADPFGLRLSATFVLRPLDGRNAAAAIPEPTPTWSTVLEPGYIIPGWYLGKMSIEVPQ